MLDNIIYILKTYRILKRYVTERLKQSWKSFLIVLAACLILIIASETLFSFSHLTDVKEVRWLFNYCIDCFCGIDVHNLYLLSSLYE